VGADRREGRRRACTALASGGGAGTLPGRIDPWNDVARRGGEADRPRQDYSLQPEPLPDLLVEVIDLAPPRDGCVCRERSGALVNVTLNLVARYARLLDQRGLLQ